MLLVEKIENYSKRIKEYKDRIIHLNNLYKKFYDKDLRREEEEIKLKLKKIKRKFKKEIYQNLEELRLIKEKFPEYFQVLISDEIIGDKIKKFSWLLEFKELNEEDAKEELEKVKSKRNQIRRLKSKIKNLLVLKIDQLRNFDVLDGIDIEELEKDELISKLDELDLGLKKKGWVIILNESLIEPYLRKFLFLFTESLNQEKELKKIYESSQGITQESQNQKNYLLARAARRKFQIKLSRFLYSNPSFLRKLKSTKPTDNKYSKQESDFFNSLKLKKLNIDDWVVDMDKLLS